jgi:hypothetical protein
MDCPDFSAEFSDISVADYWVRDHDGNYLHPEGASLVLCRSPRGEETLRRLIAAGYLQGSQLQPGNVDRAFAPLLREKRVDPFVRAERAARQGRPTPNYHLPPRRLTAKDRRLEWIQRLTFVFSRSRTLRRLMVSLLFSPLGDLVTLANITRKKWSWRRKMRRQRSAPGENQT